MTAKINGAILRKNEVLIVGIEVGIGPGLGVVLTGLPDDTIRESIGRISTSLKAVGFQFPRTKLTIHLLPAGVRKSGSSLDLPIALAILLASGQISASEKIRDTLFIGELGLDSNIHPVPGALPYAIQAAEHGLRHIVLPAKNTQQALLEKRIAVYGVTNIQEALQFINTEDFPVAMPPASSGSFDNEISKLDFGDVRGQFQAKRAMEIAAAGGHNALLIGAPGSGKTMLANRFTSILPPLTAEEQLTIQRLYAQLHPYARTANLPNDRPFRHPHHTASEAALVGGGVHPKPGEITLAHLGVLFLDEFPEFRRNAIQALREPLEEGKITISRSKQTVQYPARIQLLAAMNPCPCGYFEHPYRLCACHPASVRWYRRKISGPLLERIDLHIRTEPPELYELFEQQPVAVSSAEIRNRVIEARRLQQERFKTDTMTAVNAAIPEKQLLHFCPMEESARKYLALQMKTLQLSARSFSRILKIARTIADLANAPTLELRHVAEAVFYRSLDKPIQLELDEHLRQVKMFRAV